MGRGIQVANMTSSDWCFREYVSTCITFWWCQVGIKGEVTDHRIDSPWIPFQVLLQASFTIGLAPLPLPYSSAEDDPEINDFTLQGGFWRYSQGGWEENTMYRVHLEFLDLFGQEQGRNAHFSKGHNKPNGGSRPPSEGLWFIPG